MDSPRIEPGASPVLTLEPGQILTFAISGVAGEYTSIHLVEISGMSQATLLDPTGAESDPYSSDAGSNATVAVPLLPDHDHAGTFQLRLSSREKHRPVCLRIDVDPSHPPTARDLEFVAAEQSLAHAEKLRRSGSDANAAAALAAYEDAATRASSAGDPSLQLRALVGKARFLAYRAEQYQQAVAVATDASRLAAKPGLQPAEQALAWKTLSSVQALVNHYPEAIAAAQTSLQLYRSMHDPYWEGIVLGNLAFIYRETGDSTNALISAQASLYLARSISDDYGVAFSMSAIGSIHQGRGDFEKAIESYRDCLEIASSIHYLPVQGEVWSNLGELYSSLGDWDRAADAYQNALPLIHQAKDGVSEVEVLGRLGNLELHKNRVADAESDFRQGLQLAEREHLLRPETVILLGLARALAREGKSAEAFALVNRAIASAEQIRQIDGAAAAYSVRATLEAAARQFDTAEKDDLHAEDLWRQIPNTSELALVEADRARLAATQGKFDAARSLILSALDGIERSRIRIASQSLRTSYLSSQRDAYSFAIDLFMQLDRLYPSDGYAAQAWTIAERARARSLVDSIAEAQRNSAANAPPADNELAAEQQIKDAEDQLVRLGNSAGDRAQAHALEERIHHLALQAEELEARSADPVAQSSPNSIAPSAFAHAVLDEQSALLEYWEGSEHSYLWMVTSTSVRSYVLPASEVLHSSVARLERCLLAREDRVASESLPAHQARIARADRDFQKQSLLLSRMLLPEALPSAIHRVAIVPDGDLLSVPFAALRLPGPAIRYWAERYELIHEPSAAMLASLVSGPQDPTTSARIAIFADPVYTVTDARLRAAHPPVFHAASQTATSQTPSGRLATLTRSSDLINVTSLPRLPGSRSEALSIAQLFGASHASLHLDFDATPSNVQSLDWSSYLAVHFAAHAIADDHVSELSGIVLSMVNSAGAKQDGVLWLHDIYRMRTPVPLVALSGCHTAAGRNIPGEGVNGLARAFLASGARRVLGTLWSADDRSSSTLMRSFYSGILDQHLSAPAALRAAQLSVLRDPAHQAPYYWAAFLLEGSRKPLPVTPQATGLRTAEKMH